MHLTDMLKVNPYAKYMKDIITNKRKISEAEISTMLANYTFKGGIPNKLGDPGVPTIPCSIKRNYVKTALCDLEAGVSVMPLSLYRRLDLNKLTPTEISLQMADKSTAIPVGICEDVPVVSLQVHSMYRPGVSCQISGKYRWRGALFESRSCPHRCPCDMELLP